MATEEKIKNSCFSLKEDFEHLAALKAKLATQIDTAPLFQPKPFVASLEATYRDLWHLLLCPLAQVPSTTMQRFFNNAGPIKPEMHYHLPLLQRLDWEEVQQLIREQRYFVLHAPRQTGKTSTLLAMMQALNASGDYACAYANIEGAQAARGDETQGIPAACSAIARSLPLYCRRAPSAIGTRTNGAPIARPRIN